MRRALRVVLLVVLWLVLVLSFAGVSPLRRPVPRESEVFAGSGFDPVAGRTRDDDGALSITEPADDGSVVVVRRVDAIEAQEMTELSYRIDDFPPAMELVFLFRRADSPGDVRTLPLASPRWGRGTVRLSVAPQWRGLITEVGLAAYPAQSSPPGNAFRPFRIRALRVSTPSVSGGLSAALTEWFAPRAWALMSISALGPDGGPPRAGSFAAMMALGALGSVLVLGVGSGWSRARWQASVLLAVALAWVLLDLRWLWSLADRHRGTRQIYAGRAWKRSAATSA
ncbi:hypothetical protein PEC18_35675 [Paucibacter sp. O1-1]|nr:hypothetical protein [Paucibacter sp. O1-1]MDA3830999.1 hypothetical protein [Paucibacter sp. O1-1]